MSPHPGGSIQWMTPLSPLRTGIANYSGDFFAAVDGLWDVDAILENGSELPGFATIRRKFLNDVDPRQPLILHLGNSAFHDGAFSSAFKIAGVVVLHDVVLHHALAGYFLRSGNLNEYWRLLDEYYGSDGVAIGKEFLSGAQPDRIVDYPLSETVIRGARSTIVHSDYAAAVVTALNPNAIVHTVPMGVPQPATVDRSDARKLLGLPEDAFIITSITHVNPHKRINSVIRALRRISPRIPEALLVLAGTGSDADDLRREVQLLGIADRVRSFGYVDDATARLIASAANVAINLRYPTTGETSASLLRLLGVGLPVLVSDAGAGTDLPKGVAFKIPVDDTEIDVIAETLVVLASRDQLRADAGIVAREYVERHHSMQAMVDGYRSVLKESYEFDLPEIVARGDKEPPIPMSRVMPGDGRGLERYSATTSVGRAISSIGISARDVDISTAAQAILDLGLDEIRPDDDPVPSDRLLERLRCPGCGGSLGGSNPCACDDAEQFRGIPDFRRPNLT